MIQCIKKYIRAGRQFFNRLIPARERRLTIPTFLTFFRFFLIPVIVYAIFFNYWSLALLFFCLSAATDALDGFIARRYNQCTQLGACLDPLADKILISALFVTLAFKHTVLSLIPWWLVWLILIKELLLISGAIILFARNQRLLVKPTVWGKAAMAVQVCALVWFLIVAWNNMACPLINNGMILCVLISIIVSFVHYVYNGCFALHERMR